MYLVYSYIAVLLLLTDGEYMVNIHLNIKEVLKGIV